ncbi:uncharacterized protein LOC130712423 [Lotus japonicus]|uniref:uncharacterized protein LOC130712423 n=1 Tax=Lotus japonicus TaxID=34305 RepID=UPI0025832C51|nr:uncharacterized protein LOC130712423 [Lotus japonicus]
MATQSPITRENLQDSTHDYYIHPNENLSLVLVTPILDGSNYHSWTRAMEMSLQMKNKFGFVDGSIAKLPDTDPMLSAWKRCNNLVAISCDSWINHSVSHEIATSIIWIDTASFAWKDLKDRFSQAVKTFKKYQDNDCVLCFLRGLNDNYAAARSQILLMDPLPVWPKIFSMIIQQETS